MWDYCEMCSRIYLLCNLRQCDYCGEYYCGECNPNLNELIFSPPFADEETFCSIVCSDAYRGGFRRSRRKKRRVVDSSDSD